MSDGIAAFVRWQSGCRELEGYGISHGDTFYRGFRDYEQPYPCPNGFPIVKTLPSECEAHQRRIAKAKREIEEFSKEFRIREAAGLIKPKQVEEDIKDIKEWLRSLFTPPSASGSRESSQAEAS